MAVVTGLLQGILLIWFLGCVTTYRVGGRLLVEGEGVRSPEFGMLCLYGAGLVTYYAVPGTGRWILAAILLFWLAVQFMCHWYYTIFGASREKIEGYNRCFEGSVRIFPEREDRLVPDLYHIALHLLILLNLVFGLLNGGVS